MMYRNLSVRLRDVDVEETRHSLAVAVDLC